MGRRCSGGISNIWKIVTGHEPPFEGCCDDHDDAYQKKGGDRKSIDQQLRKCIADNGWPKLAAVMYYAVRWFGWIFWKK